MLFRIVDGFLNQLCRNAMVLHFGVHRQVNDMYPVFYVKLLRPTGIQVIPSQDKIEQCFQGMVFFQKITFRPKGSHCLAEIIFQHIVRLCFIGHHQHAV